jgi:hypothetical protein
MACEPGEAEGWSCSGPTLMPRDYLYIRLHSGGDLGTRLKYTAIVKRKSIVSIQRTLQNKNIIRYIHQSVHDSIRSLAEARPTLPIQL